MKAIWPSMVRPLSSVCAYIIDPVVMPVVVVFFPTFLGAITLNPSQFAERVAESSSKLGTEYMALVVGLVGGGIGWCLCSVVVG